MAQISVNKLGEYMTATPTRRRSIVKDQQKENPFIFARYNDARNAFCDLLTGSMSPDELDLKIEELSQFSSDKPMVESDKHASAQALEVLKELVDELEVKNVVIEKPAQFEDLSIQIAGVTVKARSDLLFRDAENNKIRGFVKLHFSQTAPLNQQAAHYVAATLKRSLEEKFGDEVELDPKISYVIDVPTESVHESPKATKKLLKDVEAACEEIAARW